MNIISKWHESPFGLSAKGVDHWENSGWGLYLKSDEGVEFLIWTSPYIVNAGKNFVKDILTIQTMLAVSEDGNRTSVGIADGPFIYKGWDLHDHITPENVSIQEGPSGITWAFKDRRYSYNGEHCWTIHGCDAHVCFDLRLKIFGQPIWYLPPKRDPLVDGEAWFWAFADADGTLNIKNRRYNVRGCGIHERHILHGDRHQLTEDTKGEGFYWILGLGEDYRFILSNFRGRGLELHFLDRDAIYTARESDITVDYVKLWTDPRSKFTVPVVWRMVAYNEELYLNALCRAYLRAYYPWTFMRSGNTVLYFFLTSIEGYYRVGRHSSGKKNLANGRGYIHMNWTYHQRSEPTD